MVNRTICTIQESGYQNKGSELIHSATISGKTLQGSCMNSLTGILHQLNSLSTVANELFQSILDASKETNTRLSNVAGRIQAVNEKLDDIEDWVVTNSSKFYANGSYVMNENNIKVLKQKTEHNVHKSNLPPALSWQYDNNCERLPDFSLLNDLHDKKDCTKDYSDPGFFFESWASFELAKLEKKKKDRLKKPKKEKVVNIEKSETKTDEFGFERKKKEQNQKEQNDFEENDYIPPPPPDMDGLDDDIPPPPQEDDFPQDDIPPPPQEDDEAPPPPPKKTVGPPPPPPVFKAPPPPPPPGESGITFSKKDVSKSDAPKTTGGRNNLLDSIRNGENKVKLKKVTIEPKQETKKPEETNSIADILANKFKNTLDSDDSDNGDDW